MLHTIDRYTMSSPKPQFYFEPVSILVGPSVEEPEAPRPEFVDFVAATRGIDSDYFFRKTVSENSEDFEVIDVHAMFSYAMTGAYNSVSKKLKEKLSPVISSDTLDGLFHLPSTVDNMLVRRAFVDMPTTVYLHKKSPTMIVPIRSDTFCVISNEAKKVQALVKELKSKCDALSTVTKDFGLALQKFLSARDYQSFLLTKMEKISKFEIGEPKNPFEKEVIEACSLVTNSFLPNVTVQFEEPNECFEYDVFINLPPRTRFIIEPTNYETVQKEINVQKLATETLKSKIILATQDKAQRLSARSIVIVNGFPEKTFAQLKTLADSRGVILMNEEDYKEKLPVELCQAILAALSRRPHRLSPRYIESY
jgi:hypothetical protein